MTAVRPFRQTGKQRLLSIICAAAASLSLNAAEPIGLNFTSATGQLMAPNETAGVISQGNWNSVQAQDWGGGDSHWVDAYDANGVMVLNSALPNSGWMWHAENSVTCSGSDDQKMMSGGFLLGGQRGQHSIAVENLPTDYPAAGYDLYIYFGPGTIPGTIWLWDDAQNGNLLATIDLSGLNFISYADAGGYVEATNYIVVKGLTGPNFGIDATKNTLVIAGVQIVPPQVVVPVAITTQPQAASTVVNQPFTLNVTATGHPINYQWRKDGSDIQGAISNTYSVALAQLTDSGTYSVRVYNSSNSIISSNAVVTVSPDTVKPLLLAAKGSQSLDQVTLSFTKPLDAIVAQNVANYTISPNVSVSAAIVVANTNIVLTTSPEAESTQYTVTVNGVKDLSGNTVATNSTAQFWSFTSVDTVPPTVVAVIGSATLDKLTVTFSEAVTGATATNLANYTLSGGVTIIGVAVVDSTHVLITTSAQAPDTEYRLTVNGIMDLAGNVIARDNKFYFWSAGPVIGLNFTSFTGSLMDPSETAGVISQRNWNSVHGQDWGGGDSHWLDVYDGNGVKVIDSTMPNSGWMWHAEGSVTCSGSDDQQMMSGGFLLGGKRSQHSISIEGLSTGFTAAGYDLYIYFGDGTIPGTIWLWDDAQSGTLVQTIYLTNLVFASYALVGGYEDATVDNTGNYIVIRGLTQPNFGIDATKNTLVIAGVQVVQKHLVTSPPLLTIARQSDGTVLVSWPTSPTGFSLQQRTSVGAGAWGAFTGQVSVQGAQSVAVVPPQGSVSMFYRLSR